MGHTDSTPQGMNVSLREHTGQHAELPHILWQSNYLGAPDMRTAPDSLRAQDVQHVIRNLEHTDTWYRDALILCNSSGLQKSRPSDPTKLE